jgi:hypothetical protein
MKKLILLTLIVILTACSGGGTPTELERNREIWQDADISHYSFTLGIGCFCAFRSDMPLTVEVRDGEIVSMMYSDGTLVTETDPGYETFVKYGTIDHLFSELEAGQNGGADEVTVKYDPTYGFPIETYFDFIAEAIDDELSLTVSGFTILD